MITIRHGGAQAQAVLAGDGTHTIAAENPAQQLGGFAYLLPDAAITPDDLAIGEKLDLLAAAMTAAGLDVGEPVPAIPPILTYFGQFIDHDITASTDSLDSGDAAMQLDAIPLLRRDRDTIVENLSNKRFGSLRLDSLYGDLRADATDLDRRVADAMRDGAKLRLGRVTPVGVRPALPLDDQADLPRFGALLDDGVLALSDQEVLILLGLDTLDAPALRAQLGVATDAEIPVAARTRLRLRAAIGDARNDENLIVAQFHVAMLRFHNAVVDRDAIADSDTAFAAARREVEHTYQWLILHDFLAALCDPAVLVDVVRDAAPLYTAFAAGATGAELPLPMEFSVAAFRFGHTMVRGTYDYNASFGVEALVSGAASLGLLFRFTGRSANPFPAQSGAAPNQTLPHNWIIEWERFIEAKPAHAFRSARALNTVLAPELNQMANEPPGMFRRLATRNLRRGWSLNLPTAQALLDSLAARGVFLPRLSVDELTSAPTGTTVADEGFDTATPLWFYVLKEAEQRGHGARLGPLGSRLVAETLVGLMVADPTSVWHRKTEADTSWAPDRVFPAAQGPVRSLADLLRAAGVL